MRGDNALSGAVALAAGLVYLLTLGPSIGFNDSGELAAAAYTFGIAHPTGYPLFTMVAGAFARLPAGGPVIWKLNLFAALCCAGAVFLIHRVFLALLSADVGGVVPAARGSRGARRPLKRTSAKTASQPEVPAADRTRERNTNRKIAASAGTLILAFSRAFWSAAVSLEVYALHLLLLALVLFLFLRALPEGAFAATARADPSGRRGRWSAVALVLGLGFSNHMTTALLLPGLGYLYFATQGFSRPAWKTIARAVPFFILGVLDYLYLPLRAATWPALNWGAITDSSRFLWHVSGRQYREWLFSSLDVTVRQSALFVTTLPSEFGYAALVPAVVGVFVLLKHSRRLFIFTLLLFAGCLLAAVNYNISDIENYFLLAYLVLALWAAFGLKAFLDRVRQGAMSHAMAMACAVCVLLPLSFHYRAVDETGNYGAEDYARNVLGPLEPNAVILSGQWEHFIAPAHYLQRVEGVRPDVVVLDLDGLWTSWYYRNLGHHHPWLLEAARADVQAFLPELYKFEHEIPYDPAGIDRLYNNVVAGLLRKSLATRAVYTTPDIKPESTGDLMRVPSGPGFRLFQEDAEPAYVPVEFRFRPFPKDNVFFQSLRRYYSAAYGNHGVYLAVKGDFAGAESLMRRGLAIDPESRDLPMRLQWLEQARRAKPGGYPAR